MKEVTIKGKKIGFLALSYPEYSWVVQDNREKEGLGCAYINDLCVNHVIIEAKKTLDYLFILPHYGIEYMDIPMPEVIARYRDFIDYGADGVFGAHPHCPQGREEYNGKPIFIVWVISFSTVRKIRCIGLPIASTGMKAGVLY